MSERLFDLPDIDAIAVEKRLSALPQALQALIQRTSDALTRGRMTVARDAATMALAQAPTQPDVLRMAGVVDAHECKYASARERFDLALHHGGDDALLYRQYAEMLEQSGSIEQAFALRKQAVERLPGSALASFDLGEHCFRYEDMDAAIAALQRAIELAPGYVPAMLKLGSALVYAGRIEEGAAAYRQVLVKCPDLGAAWFSLANIKTLPFTPDEVAQMQRMVQSAAVQEPDRTVMEFALAKAYEDEGSFAQAFSLLTDANARQRRRVQWSSTQFSEQVRHAEQVFAASHAVVENSDFGNEAVFIVGLPRSGTTLVEQIISAHPNVEGANELGDLARILAWESARLRQPYPQWVTHATSEDWRRLGQLYLDSTARWRRRRPIFTDKMPSNWLFIGAIRAMLPGARIVVCRRDPLENCWSCFKQFFFSGWDFTFSLDEIAAYWKDFDSNVSGWARREPGRIREQHYEAMIDNPEREIRELLDFCALPFDEACLRFHESNRSVRTASAGQVRQPLQRNARRADRYGALLDPLRTLLGMPAWGKANSYDAERG